MKAVCPKDPTHKQFVTVAYISQDWLVDEKGNFEEVFGYESQTLHGPNFDNIWTCSICGEVAEIKT